jgi:hypothetical protein
MTTSRPIKRCKCGRTHTVESWTRLPLLGRNDLGVPNEPDLVEWRNCPCGSTLVVSISDLPDARSTVRVLGVRMAVTA